MTYNIAKMQEYLFGEGEYKEEESINSIIQAKNDIDGAKGSVLEGFIEGNVKKALGAMNSFKDLIKKYVGNSATEAYANFHKKFYNDMLIPCMNTIYSAYKIQTSLGRYAVSKKLGKMDAEIKENDQLYAQLQAI